MLYLLLFYQSCGWFSRCDAPSIYGRPLDYWLMKEHYWQVRLAVWSSFDKELSGMSSFLSTQQIDNATKTPHPEAVKRAFGRRPTGPVAKDRRDSKRTGHFLSKTMRSESVFNNIHTSEGTRLHEDKNCHCPPLFTYS